MMQLLEQTMNKFIRDWTDVRDEKLRDDVTDEFIKHNC